MTNKKYWKFKNLVTNQETQEIEEVELSINGEIVNIACWDGDVSSKTFKSELDKYPNAKQITVGLNTPGGDIFEAVQIGNYLRNHPAKVVCKIYALCASAGATIASSCDEIQMYDNGIYMIHDPMTVGAGGIENFKKVVERLEIIKQSVINVYKNHTHLEDEAISKLMTDETWMTAEQALENGFITEILTSKAEPEKVEEVQNFMHDQVWNNFKKFPKNMFKNLISTSKEPKVPVIENKIGKGSDEVMDLNEFKNSHKNIYEEASKEVKNLERERITKIVNLGAKYGLEQEIVNKAIGEGKSEGDFAFDIMNNTEILTGFKAKNQQEELKTETKDAGINNIKTEEPANGDNEEKKDFVKNTANLIKQYL